MTPDDINAIQAQFGLSAIELADMLGVHYQTVHGWRTGRHPMPESITRLLAFIVRERAIMSSKTARKILEVALTPLEPLK